MKILIFGASHEMGYWDKKGGWVQRLIYNLSAKSIKNKRLIYKIYNLGISGNTTQDLLLRFENEITYRVPENTPHEKLIFIFNYGTSDSCYRESLKGNNVDENQFKANLSEVNKLARKYTDNLFFLESPLVNENLVNPVPWNNDFYYKNKNISLYNKIKEEFCKDNNIEFIKFSSHQQSLSFDGLHQNSKGHKNIYMNVKKSLEEKGLI